MAKDAERQYAVAYSQVADSLRGEGDGENGISCRVQEIADDGGGFIACFAADDQERRRCGGGEQGEDEPIFQGLGIGILDVERLFEIPIELGAGDTWLGQGQVGEGPTEV